MTMGILAANERADRAEAKASKAMTDLAEYKAATGERIARLETTQLQNVESVKGLDTTLQREMRLLDEKTRSEGIEIDKRLQSEMDLKMVPLRDAIRVNGAEIDRLRAGAPK
jgi:hypothetical protein